MKWVYPKGKPTDSINLQRERELRQAEQAKAMNRYARITYRTGPQFIVLLSLMLTFCILTVLGICYSCNRLNYLTTSCAEVKATVIDSSEQSSISMVFLWSEIQYEVNGTVRTEILKYTTTSTKIGDTVLVFYDELREKAYNLSIYWFNIGVFALIFILAVLRGYGYIYDFIMQGVQKRRLKKLQNQQKREK